MKPTGTRRLTMAALTVFVMQTQARAECPELDRLRVAFIKAWDVKEPACDHYWRLSLAAKAWEEYACRNVESCSISGHLLFQIEREYRDVAETRDNVCAGRPKRPLPAEIMPR
jgi:hypothetical protein